MAFAALLGFGLQRYLAQDRVLNDASISASIGQPRPEFSMLDLDGKLRNISEWDGKVVLLNFWATWCPPCMKEIPVLIELQQQYGDKGLQVVGVAVDNVEAVRSFATQVGINYPLLPAEDGTIELAERYGNHHGALPYTVFIAANGEISYTLMGELHKEKALTLLNALGVTD